MKKYIACDLGNGLLITLNPENYESQVGLMIPNLFAVQNAIGRIKPPSDSVPYKDFDLLWSKKCDFADRLVNDLNNNSLTEDEAKKLIEISNSEVK